MQRVQDWYEADRDGLVNDLENPFVPQVEVQIQRIGPHAAVQNLALGPHYKSSVLCTFCKFLDGLG
jgi:hypothetical protein